MSATPADLCSVCGDAASDTVTLQDCGKCKSTVYCSDDCQNSDQATHELQCRPVCANCDEAASATITLQECNVCKSVVYCGDECQNAHMATHKPRCTAIFDDRLDFLRSTMHGLVDSPLGSQEWVEGMVAAIRDPSMMRTRQRMMTYPAYIAMMESHGITADSMHRMLADPDYAQQLIQSLPERLAAAAESPDGIPDDMLAAMSGGGMRVGDNLMDSVGNISPLPAHMMALPDMATISDGTNNPLSDLAFSLGCLDLTHACTKSDISAVRTLIEAGADVAKVTMMRTTDYVPLDAAAEHGPLEIVKLLIDAGAVADRVAKDGVTPTYIASQGGHLDIVEYLVEDQGAPFDAPAHDGRCGVVVAATVVAPPCRHASPP